MSGHNLGPQASAFIVNDLMRISSAPPETHPSSDVVDAKPPVPGATPITVSGTEYSRAPEYRPVVMLHTIEPKPGRTSFYLDPQFLTASAIHSSVPTLLRNHKAARKDDSFTISTSATAAGWINVVTTTASSSPLFTGGAGGRDIISPSGLDPSLLALHVLGTVVLGLLLAII